MGEQDRLSGLDVGGPGQDGVAVAIRQPDQRPLEPDHPVVERVDRPAQPEPQVGRDLVVSRATRMQLPGDRSDAGRECRLEVEMDVLEVGVPGERPGDDLGPYALEPRDQAGHLVIGEQARPAKPMDVGDGSVKVVERQRGVDLDRAGELGHPSVARLAEPTAPQLHRVPPSVRPSS